MTLLDRLIGTEEPKFPVHDFYAVNRMYAQGDATRAELRNMLNGSADVEHHLSAAEETQWGNWADNIDAQNANGKVIYVDRIHAYLILGESGLATKAQIKAWLSVPD
jgi:hypothetical protein